MLDNNNLISQLAQRQLGPDGVNRFAQSKADMSTGFIFDPITLLVLFLGLVLIGGCSIIFWPYKRTAKDHQKRKFTRIDHLHFKLNVFILPDTKLDSNDLKTKILSENVVEGLIPIPVRVSSLSLGGCAIYSDRNFRKGETLVISLHELPDFPSQESFYVGKIVWVRPDRKLGKSMATYGIQLKNADQIELKSRLKKYLNYLLDQPLI